MPENSIILKPIIELGARRTAFSHLQLEVGPAHEALVELRLEVEDVVGHVEVVLQAEGGQDDAVADGERQSGRRQGWNCT